MEVGIYCHGGNMSVAQIVFDLRKLAISARDGNGCICQRDSLESLPGLAFCHPQDSEDCYSAFRKVIRTNPHTKFYICAMGKDDRIEQIGEYPNVNYLTWDNINLLLKKLFVEAMK